METRTRHRLTGRIHVSLPPDRAFRLFTARGERDWVDGWHPTFPAGADDDAEAGTAFVTAGHGCTTTWMVADSEPGRRLRYVRIIPGVNVAMVTVSLAPDGDGSEVTVSYDLTALAPGADRQLDEFAAGYPAYLRSWQDAIENRTSA
jgi:hypothetical protein